MTSVHHDAAQRYRSTVKAVRLSRLERSEAFDLQRKGRTMREIAEVMELPLNVVQQSLYWDEVAK